MIKMLSQAEKITAASGVVLFFSLFFPWLEGLTAWELFDTVGALLALLAVVAVALTLARAARVNLPVRTPIKSILRDVAVVILTVTIAFLLEASDRGAGIWFSCLAALGILYGAATMPDEHASPRRGDQARAGQPVSTGGDAATASPSPRGQAASRNLKRELREDLLGDAFAIEVETQGFLPQSGFTKAIDEGILPHARPEETEARLLVPIVMSVDRGNAPVEFPDQTVAAEVGVVACFSDRAIFAWMVGLLRAKVYSHVERYQDITDLSPFTAGHVSGLDITARSKWSVLFGEQIRAHLVEEWKSALAEELLAGSASDGREPPTQHGSQA